MIMPDHEIRKFCIRNKMVVPYESDLVQPASYDVRLGNVFQIPRNHGTTIVDTGNQETFKDLMERVELGEGEVLAIHPGEFILGCTLERVNIPHAIVARIEGKSSLARLGLMVHVTAGYIDPGFRGSVTMEMANMLRVPIIVRPGMAIAQLSFDSMSSAAAEPYQGRYQDDDDATASRYSG